MSRATKVPLDPHCKSNLAKEFETALRGKIIGQETALDKVASLYQVYLAGLNPLGRPIGNLLFLGPTGSGKTRMVEAVAEALYGDSHAMIKIDCAEFQHSHEIAKLIGSPPGYLGHRETHPVLTQEALNAWHNGKVRVSILLLDEIEKASDSLWQLLLGMMDKATLTLGDNRRVDLSETIIFMTSNLGAREMARFVEGGIGFGPAPKDCVATHPVKQLKAKVERTALEAARRRFSPEFLNRLDQIVVFQALNRSQMEEILDLELNLVQNRVLAAGDNRFVFHLSSLAKTFLLEEGLDQRYGARHLKRAIERHLVQPLASLIASGQIHDGDQVAVDLAKNDDGKLELSFVRESEGLVFPADLQHPAKPAIRPAVAAAATGSRGPRGGGLIR